jgi:transcription antitermination factor NusG
MDRAEILNAPATPIPFRRHGTVERREGINGRFVPRRYADEENLDWYALVTKPQHEFVCAGKIQDMGHAVFVPYASEWRRKSRYSKAKVQRHYPLMPRYIFVGFDCLPPWLDLHAADCMQGVVGVGGYAKKLPTARVIELINTHGAGVYVAPAAQQFMRTHHEFAVGDRVQIVDGPLYEHFAEVTAIDGKKARILFEIFNEVLDIEIALDDLVIAR